MPAGDSEPDQTSDPDVPQHAPFTAWPDSRGGYVVLDLRTTTPVAGPFPSVEWAIAEMDRLNAEHAVGTPNPASADGTARSTIY